MNSRVNGYINRIRDELRKSFTQDYSPREVAGSFALGVFITMLPTLGVGLVVFMVFAYLFERINKIALFASVLVLNPVVKWGVYAASISLGFFLLGPVDGFDGGGVTLDDGLEVLVRLWVGNLILAGIATAIAYPVAYRMVTSYRARELDIVGKTVETVVEGFEELRDDSKSDGPGDTDSSPSMAADTDVDGGTEVKAETETEAETEADTDDSRPDDGANRTHSDSLDS